MEAAALRLQLILVCSSKQSSCNAPSNHSLFVLSFLFFPHPVSLSRTFGTVKFRSEPKSARTKSQLKPESSYPPPPLLVILLRPDLKRRACIQMGGGSRPGAQVLHSSQLNFTLPSSPVPARPLLWCMA